MPAAQAPDCKAQNCEAQEAAAREALRACFVSVAGLKPADAVALGLVVSVQAAPDPEAPGAGIPGVPARFRLVCTLLAPPGDPDGAAAAMLHALAANRLAGMPQWSRIQVRFADEPVWTAARIDPATRRALGLDPPLFPILGNRR